MCHRLIGRTIPFSMFLHAGTDLYRDQVYLKQKLRYADVVVTCTRYNKEYIVKHYGGDVPGVSEKTHVYYHGLDLAELPFRLDGRVPGRLVAVGSLDKAKGYDYLLRAVHGLRGRGLDLSVELIGDGPEAAALRALAQELGIADRVSLAGWLPFARVREAMQRASVFVHPSWWEGMPNVLKEAMACGTPVVATRIAAIPELLADGERGTLVPPHDVPGLARAIEELLGDEPRRRRYAVAARHHIEQAFDLSRNGRRLAELLVSVTRREQAAAPMPVA
jgi:glycosyltransferase involved in cell wall biosynthesis